MKIWLLFLGILFCTSNLFGQREFILWPYDATSGKIIFNESIHLPGANKNTLFENAKNFVKNNFKSGRDTISFNEPEQLINCRGAYFIPVNELGDRGNGYISYRLSIWYHDNFYRYRLSDLEHHATNFDGISGGPLESDKAAPRGISFPQRYWNEQKGKCYYRIQTTIEQLKQAMLTNIEQ